jgi:hypothetical protein
MLKASRFVLIVALIFSIGMLDVNRIEAQSVQYGKLTGKVILSTGEPIAGVSVEITSEALITGKRTTISSQDGDYIFFNLPVGKYKLKAILKAFKTFTQTKIVISAGAVTTVNVMMEEGKIQEMVTVTASPQVVDVRTSTIDSRLNNDLLQKVPTSRDAFYDLSLTTPGMFAVGRDASWLPSPTAYGGATNENNFLVDGVNTTNPRGASWGSMVHVNYNAVQEIRLLSLGTKAEYGNFSGVAIDVLTKSGGNNIHGSIGYYSMIGSPRNNVPGAGDIQGSDFLFIQEGDNLFYQDKRDNEFSLTFGGPVARNKLWFFTAFNHTDRHTQEPNFDPTKDWRGAYYDLKLTAQPSMKHRISAAYHYENNRTDGTSWGNLMWDPSMRYSTKNKTHMISANWMYNMSSITTFTAKYLGFWSNDDPILPDGVPEHPGYVNWWKFIPKDMAVNGAMPWIEAQNANRNTIQADVSHYAEKFLGQHDMKFGVQYTSGRGDWFGGYFHGYKNMAYPQPWTTSLAELQAATPQGYPMYVERHYRNPFLTVRKSSQFGAFFDDQWTIGSRLTFNIGFRYDKTVTKFGEGKIFELVQNPHDNIEDLAVIRTRSSGSGNVFDFDTLSPRIGFTYMLTSDGKTVLRASYGRYYLPIGVESMGKNGPDNELITRVTEYYYVPWDGLDTDGDGEIFGYDVAEATRRLHNLTPYSSNTATIDPSWEPKPNSDLTNQHTDQFTVNLERELLPDLSISATYIHRETRNMIVRWPINEVTGEPWEYQQVDYVTSEGQNLTLWSIVPQDYNGDGAVNPADVQWVYDHDDFEWRNLKEFAGKKARRLYQGIQFTINKRYSNRWQLLASFLYSSTDGVARRSIRQDVNMEGPYMLENDWIGDLNQLVNNMEGPLPYTPKYEVKVSGSYRIPTINVDVGMRLRYSSGRAAWLIEPVPLEEPWMGSIDPNLVIAPRSGSYLVSGDVKNPVYYEPQTIVDLHLEREFKLGGIGNLRVMLDWYNMLNEDAVTNSWWRQGAFGRVYMLTYPSSKIKLGALFNF